MTRIQLGFMMPDDPTRSRGKAGRATFVDDLNRALNLVAGHFDSAWIVDHLQSGAKGSLEGVTALGVDNFILDCSGFPKLTTLELLVNEVLPALNS